MIVYILKYIIMAAYTNAKEYNTYLVNNDIDINIINYVKEVNDLIYNIDISFIDKFLDLVEKDEICIPHEYLIKYSVITTERSNNVLQMFDQFDAIENVDYNLLNVQQVRTQRGTVIKKQYTLHPRLFKLCLMRSKNTLKYSKYYLLLEECIKYYNDYKDKMKQTEINRLINKLDTTNNKLDKAHEDNEKLHEDNKKTHEDNEKLHENNKKTHDKLDRAIDELKESNEQLKESNEQLKESNENLVSLHDEFDIVHDKLDDRVPNAKKKNISERFVVLKHDTENMYYIITRKERTIKMSIDRMKDSGYKKIIIQYECCPNARLLLNDMKDNMKGYYEFSSKGNCREFKLHKAEEEYINKLTELYNARRV
jgi:hypothetical protein